MSGVDVPNDALARTNGHAPESGGASTGVGPAAIAASETDAARLDEALARIAAEAVVLDRAPRFPRQAFFELTDVGALATTIGAIRRERSVRAEWELLRRVAAADASVARVLDGHLNAVERLEVAAEPELRERELAAVKAGHRLLGVWGADPGPGEGDPARLVGPATALSCAVSRPSAPAPGESTRRW